MYHIVDYYIFGIGS